jgi:8-oxo-dGTP pyrophosphatase MutT (NUDIX family)
LDRELLIKTLTSYVSDFREEHDYIPAFLELLKHPRAYYRDHLPGHITASALIVDEKAEHILLLHHKKLNRWLQPGGHADGDENIIDVAKKEVTEETGLQKFVVHSGVFDVDIHNIPGRPDFPEHRHFDIRFLFQTKGKAELMINEESNAFKWVPLATVSDVTVGGDSILRMAMKARRLFTRDKQ